MFAFKGTKKKKNTRIAAETYHKSSLYDSFAIFHSFEAL